MTPTIAFDFDGTLANTLDLAMVAANRIQQLLDPVARPFTSRAQYRSALNYDELVRAHGPVAAEALTDLHPLLVSRLAQESPPMLFPGMIDVARALPTRPAIITAGYASTVELALGDHRAVFGTVVGREEGLKDDLMKAMKASSTSVLVTDTRTDVRRAASLGWTTVGVAWGYDGVDALVEACATWTVTTPSDLAHLLDGIVSGRVAVPLT